MPTATDVLATEARFMSGADTYRFPIIGGLQASMITPFAGKVVIGDTTQSSQILLSEHVMSDWSGGMLVEDLDEASQQDRFWYGTSETRFRKKLLLGTRQESMPGTPAGVQTAGVMFNGVLYMAFGVGGGGGGGVWVHDGATWVDSTHDHSGIPTCAIAYRQQFSRWLIIGTTNGYTKYNLATWTNVASSGVVPYKPNAYALVVHDGYVWAIDENLLLWKCTDLGTDTWTTKQNLPVDEPSGLGVIGLVVYQNPAGDPAIHAVLRSGIWYYDEEGGRWIPTAAQWPRMLTTETNSQMRATLWRGDLYVALPRDIWQYNPTTIRNVGFTRDDGLANALVGTNVVQCLANAYNWLAAAVGPHVFLWNGTAWHYGFPGSTNDRVFWLGFGAFTAGVSGRLIAVDNHTPSNTSFMAMPLGVFNPLETASSNYQTGSYHVTGWFDSGWPLVPKTAVRVHWLADNLSAATREIAIEYQVDTGTDQGTWTPLVAVTSTADSSQDFAAGVGVVFKRIRFRFSLATNNVTISPIIRSVTLYYLKRPTRVYAYSFQVSTTQDYDGRTPFEQRRVLKLLNETDTLVTVGFARDGHEVITEDHNVLITVLNGALAAGADDRGIFNVACSGVG